MNKKLKLSDIKIKPSFEESIPRKEKIEECRNNYLMKRKQDRFIVVNHDGYLIDGYIMFLILRELGIDEAEVKVSERRMECWNRKAQKKPNRTTYIYGVHPSLKYACGYTKEYVWRVPDSWIGWADDLLPGDMIYVSTKHGVAPVIVSKIEWSDECPMDMKVKKVVGKMKKEGI